MEETLNPKTQTQQAPQPFFPQHTPTKKFKIFWFFFFYLLPFSLFRCPQNPDVRPSVRSVLSVTPPPLQFKIQEKKKPGIFNLNRPNPKLDPTLWYSNSSTSRYPRTKFSKEKKTPPYFRHPLTISQPQKKSFLQISELLSHHGALDFYGAGGSKEGRKG
jgi:hypothetical protein